LCIYVLMLAALVGFAPFSLQVNKMNRTNIIIIIIIIIKMNYVTYFSFCRTNRILPAPYIRRCAKQHVLQFCISVQISRFPRLSSSYLQFIFLSLLQTVSFTLLLSAHHCVPHLSRQALDCSFQSLPPTVLPWMFQAGTTNSYAPLNIMQLASFHRLQSHNCVHTLMSLFQYLSWPYLLSSQYLLLFLQYMHNYMCLVSKFRTSTVLLI
jgi:hypothetical protein